MAERLGRKQEASVVVVGLGGEQKNWSRLEGKWAWWTLPSISQIPTDHKVSHFARTKITNLFVEIQRKSAERNDL